MATIPPSAPRRGMGFIPDPRGKEYTSAHRLLGALAKTPAVGGLREFAGPIRDQDFSSACVGFGMARGITDTLAALGTPLDGHASELSIYTPARCVDRVVNPDGTFPRLLDQGSSPYQAIASIGTWGVALEKDWPFDIGTLLQDPSLINEEPDLPRLVEMSKCRLEGAYRIDHEAPDFVARVRQALAGKHAVGFAMEVDRKYMDNMGEMVGPQVGPSLGGHWQVAEHYETSQSGETIVDVAGSWGVSFGQDGWVRGGEDFMRRWYSVIVLDIALV